MSLRRLLVTQGVPRPQPGSLHCCMLCGPTPSLWHPPSAALDGGCFGSGVSWSLVRYRIWSSIVIRLRCTMSIRRPLVAVLLVLLAGGAASATCLDADGDGYSARGRRLWPRRLQRRRTRASSPARPSAATDADDDCDAAKRRGASRLRRLRDRLHRDRDVPGGQLRHDRGRLRRRQPMHRRHLRPEPRLPASRTSRTASRAPTATSAPATTCALRRLRQRPRPRLQRRQRLHDGLLRAAERLPQPARSSACCTTNADCADASLLHAERAL